MLLNHVGIFNKYEQDALRFYRDFLEFELTREFTLSSVLSEQLFALDQDIKMMVFEKDGTKLEVFICPECKQPSPDLNHMGFLLDNLQEFTEKAAQAGVEHIIGQAADKTVHFIKDFSGNLIEIKQK